MLRYIGIPDPSISATSERPFHPLAASIPPKIVPTASTDQLLVYARAEPLAGTNLPMLHHRTRENETAYSPRRTRPPPPHAIAKKACPMAYWRGSSFWKQNLVPLEAHDYSSSSSIILLAGGKENVNTSC